jgi:hypothetical protein
MVGLVVHCVAIQDRDGAPEGLKTILKRWPWLRHVFADGGYTGPKPKGALQKVGSFVLEIVMLPDGAPRALKSFHAAGWLNEHCRRFARISSAQSPLPNLVSRRPHPPAHEAHRKSMKSLRSF